MKKLQLLLLAGLAFTNTYAQKLPNVQQVGLRAPANVKIDGKTEEWGDFKARNSATDILYTIANDDSKLYLVVQIDDATGFNRAISGGIKLMVQTNGSKSDQGAAGIKFPFFEDGNGLVLRVKMAGEVNSPSEADSIMKVYNKTLAANLKWIYTKGIPGTDSVLSVYNDKGITTAGAFNEKRYYTCEMAIDLKQLGLSAAQQQKFSYHIIINAMDGKPSIMQRIGGISLSRGTNGDGTPMSEAQITASNLRMQKVTATTDFWGEYTLAK